MSDLEVTNALEDAIPFEYSPLQPGFIRILLVENCSNANVECTLYLIKLEDYELPWYALSHVWGTAERNQEILLNGQSFYTTPNLLAALKALDALQKGENRSMLIWIDAICINQDDEHEKAQQVPIMDRIFSKATCVLIWLGPLESGEQIFVEVLTWLSAYIYIEEKGFNLEQSEQLDSASHILETSHQITRRQLQALWALIKDIEALDGNTEGPTNGLKALLDKSAYSTDLLPPAHPFWVSFLVYMHHEWFHRVWTKQEVWLARAGVLLYTDGVGSYQSMLRCRKALFTPNFEFLWGGGFPESQEMEKRGYNRDQLRASLGRANTQHINPRSPDAFQAALLGLEGLRATIAKDYIYGMMGLLDASTRSGILVDYSSSNSDASVFANAVRLACSQPDQATVLPLIWEVYRQVESTVQDLPTWCPDFSNSWNCPDPMNVGTDSRYWLQVRAAYSTLARVDCDCPDMSIRFAGIQLETISRSVECCPLYKYEDASGSLADVQGHRLQVVDKIFTKRNVHWLETFDATFCVEGGGTLDGTMRNLDELFRRTREWGFDLTHDRLQRLLYFARKVEDGSISTFDEAVHSTHWPDDLGWNAIVHMLDLLLRFNGACVFETTVGNVGFCYRPVSPKDRILLVPGGGCLHAISADCSHYNGVVHVQGWTEELVLQLRPELESRLEIYCVS